MHAAEESPYLLAGWFIAEIGRRQAWPFLTLANPDTGHELRLYIDTSFAVQPTATRVRQHDDEALTALIPLENQTITAVKKSGGELHLSFPGATMVLDTVGNELTSHSPWWIGASTSL
jgi:nitroreductase